MADPTIYYEGHPVLRAEALSRQLPRYFTGMPCVNGHRAERLTHSRRCAECARITNLVYRPRTTKEDAALRPRRAIDPLSHNAQVQKLLDERRAVAVGKPKPVACQICCGNSGGIVFDHCHSTGRFRGWICGHCNKAIGLAKDSPAVLRLMAQYLERFYGGEPTAPYVLRRHEETNAYAVIKKIEQQKHSQG